MSQLPSDGTIQVKPQSNVFTLMMIITVLVLGVAIGLVLHKLTSPMAQGGYEIPFGDLFGPIKIP